MLRNFLAVAGALLATIFAAQPASAEWLRAETQNFVIHADLGEEELREVALHMEEFDRLLQRQMPAQLRPGRKFEMWLDRGSSRISRLFGFRIFSAARNWQDLAGAFAQYDPGESDLHRFYPLYAAYASYYQSNGYVRISPYWLRYGMPIFFSTAVVRDGNFILGRPDQRRPMKGRMTPGRIEEILTVREDPESFEARSQAKFTSGVFTNLLLSDPANDVIVRRYLTMYNSGSTHEEAMAAFGDLSELAKVMRRKMDKDAMLRAVPIDPDAPKDILIEPMGEDEIALVVPRFRRLEDDDRQGVARELRELAERFPDSAETWYQYAAAEFALTKGLKREDGLAFGGLGFADNFVVIKAWHYPDKAAWDAVNRALALDPGHPHARRLKAEIMLERVLDDGDVEDPSQFEDVRALLAPLVARPKEFPYAAVLNYQTYIEQGLAAPQEAFDAFGRAFLGSAGVGSFRYAYAAELVRRGEDKIARRLLESMLNEPRLQEAAQRALDQIPRQPN